MVYVYEQLSEGKCLIDEMSHGIDHSNQSMRIVWRWQLLSTSPAEIQRVHLEAWGKEEGSLQKTQLEKVDAERKREEGAAPVAAKTNGYLTLWKRNLPKLVMDTMQHHLKASA